MVLIRPLLWSTALSEMHFVHKCISEKNIHYSSSKNRNMLFSNIFWTLSPRQFKAADPCNHWNFNDLFFLCVVDGSLTSGPGIHITPHTCWHCLRSPTNPLHFPWIGGKSSAAVSFAVAPRGAESCWDRLDRRYEPNVFVHTSWQLREITKSHLSSSLWHQQAPPPSCYNLQQALTSRQRAGLHQPIQGGSYNVISSHHLLAINII